MLDQRLYVKANRVIEPCPGLLWPVETHGGAEKPPKKLGVGAADMANALTKSS